MSASPTDLPAPPDAAATLRVSCPDRRGIVAALAQGLPFLPAFGGSRPDHQAHARGVKLVGATAHHPTADLDEGLVFS